MDFANSARDYDYGEAELAEAAGEHVWGGAMNSTWSFGDDVPLGPLFRPGEPCCYHCGSPAPEGVPDFHARCQVCGFHLHTCPNCMFYNGLGCLILEPAIWSDTTVMGKFCPSFNWRQDEGPG